MNGNISKARMKKMVIATSDCLADIAVEVFIYIERFVKGIFNISIYLSRRKEKSVQVTLLRLKRTKFF